MREMRNSDNWVLFKIYAIDGTAVAATVKTRAAEVAVNDTIRVSFPSWILTPISVSLALQ